MKMYVGGLQYSTTEDELKELFATYGTPNSVNLIKDNFSGQSKGFGFVEMQNNSEADQAIKNLNGSSFQGRVIKVNQAQQKKSNSRSSRGRRF